MHRHVEHLRIVLEDVLRAVAVMHVVVDDGDAVGAERAGVRGGDGDVVVEAEAHRAVALGVMAGRPHQRERAACAAAHHPLDGVDRGAGREQRDLVRSRGRVGVGIERDRLTRRSRRSAAGSRRRARAPAARASPRAAPRLRRPLPPGAGHDVHHLGPFGPLRMPGRRLVFGEPVGADENQGHAMLILILAASTALHGAVHRSSGRAPHRPPMPGPALRARAAAPRATARARSIAAPSASAATSNGSPMAIATVENGLGICVRSQLLQRPVPVGLEMKRQHRIAGRLRQPHRARLRHPRRTARAVDGEAGRPPGGHVALQLQQRPAAPPRDVDPRAVP